MATIKMATKEQERQALAQLKEIIDLDKTEKELEQARKELELARKTAVDESERRKEIWNRLKETEKTAMENLNELAEARAEVKWQEEEIIRLKVKCFDLMEKGCKQ